MQDQCDVCWGLEQGFLNIFWITDPFESGEVTDPFLENEN